MPTGTPANFRSVKYISTRVLTAAELNTQQQIARQVGPDNAPTSFGLNSEYKTGALRNVTVATSGTVVTLSATSSTLPMLVFLRGVWEPFQANPINTGAGTSLFLNYTLTSIAQEGNDAEMAELAVSLSAVSTHGSIVAPVLEKNTAAIPVMAFSNVAGVLTYLPVDMTYLPARGNQKQAGIVSLTTNSSSGLAVASDDPVNTNQRVPTVGSVNTSKVQAIVPSGTNNTDGTVNYNPAGPGGISSAQLIYAPGQQTVEDAIRVAAATIATDDARLGAHIGASLRLPGVHPMPSYYDVGAAPIGHVGSNFDNKGSHDPTMNDNHLGFRVIRDPSVPAQATEYAYSLLDSTNISNPIIGMSHTGDLVTPLLAYPNLSTAMSVLLALVPLVSDLSIATYRSVTDSACHMDWLGLQFGPNGGNPIEICIGMGYVRNGGSVPLPNGNFNYTSFLATAALAWAESGGNTINNVKVRFSSPGVVDCEVANNNGFGSGRGDPNAVASVSAIAWRAGSNG